MAVERWPYVPPGSRTSSESGMLPLIASSTEKTVTVSMASLRSRSSVVYDETGEAMTIASARWTMARSGGTTYVAAKSDAGISASARRRARGAYFMAGASLQSYRHRRWHAVFT